LVLRNVVTDVACIDLHVAVYTSGKKGHFPLIGYKTRGCVSEKGDSKEDKYQYNETNVMHFLFNLLRIKGLYMFQTLLAYRPTQEALNKRHLVYYVRVMSDGCTMIGAANRHNTHAIYQVPFVERLLRMSK
jgi:hypothetical protein